MMMMHGAVNRIMDAGEWKSKPAWKLIQRDGIVFEQENAFERGNRFDQREDVSAGWSTHTRTQEREWPDAQRHESRLSFSLREMNANRHEMM